MATLDELLKIDGVVAAGEFTADGKLVDYKSKMDMSEYHTAYFSVLSCDHSHQPVDRN